MRSTILMISLIITVTLMPTIIAANYQMLVECVEDYTDVGQSNLKYTCDAGNSFIAKITNAGSYSYRFYQDSAAWPSDWWTKEVGGLSYYPSYHAYMHDYAMFLGHGAPAFFMFGVKRPAVDGNSFSVVWLVSEGPNGYTWMYPHDNDGDGRYPRWITIYACNVLDADSYAEIGYTVFDVFYYTFTNQGKSVPYLHGIVSARTALVDWYKSCLICSEVPVSVNTMNDYANRLISGNSIVDAWFNAIWTQNYAKDIFGRKVLQAQPAALYYVVEFRDSNGNILASYNYRYEGMLGFSTTTYPAPFQLSAPPGTTQIIYRKVYLYGS